MPLQNGYSPAELLMGRQLCTTVLVSPELLQPKVPNYSSLASKEKATRDKQKRNFDKRHKARELKPLAPGDSVWIPSIQVEGTVRKKSLQDPTTCLEARDHCIGIVSTCVLFPVHTLLLIEATQKTSNCRSLPRLYHILNPFQDQLQD